MVRTLELESWAGRWVAIDPAGVVRCDATTLAELLRNVRRDEIQGVAVMRAPDPANRSSTALVEPWTYPYTDFGEGRGRLQQPVLRAVIEVGTAPDSPNFYAIVDTADRSRLSPETFLTAAATRPQPAQPCSFDSWVRRAKFRYTS